MDYRDSSGFSTPPTVSIDTCDSGFTELYCAAAPLSTGPMKDSSQFVGIETNNHNHPDSSRRHLSNDSTSSGESNLSSSSNCTTNTTHTDCGISSGSGGIGIINSLSGGCGSVVNQNNRIHDTTNINGNTRPATFDLLTMDNNLPKLQLQNSLPKENGNYERIHIDDDDENDDNNDNGNNDVDDDDDDDDDDNDDGTGDSDDDDDVDDESSSNLSHLSELSDVLKLNASILPDVQRSLDWVHLQIASGVKPRECLSRVFMNASTTIPANLSDGDLWRIIATMLSDPPRRDRLHSICTIGDVIELLKKSTNVLVLTGAGVSVSCGIPDFRSRSGIYSRLRKEFPEMIDPQSMFDIRYFYQDPRPFYKFAKEIYPGLFTPSPCHRFIRLLEKKHKLLRNYSQNIDTLERVAEIQNVIECHGSFATASCTKCQYKVTSADIKHDILAQKIPLCPICNPQINDKIPIDVENHRDLVGRGIMKPDIVFFGESLPDEFHATVELDKSKCDLLIVIGSSLKVRPVALIPSSLPANIPQILINREQLDNFGFDVELLGDSDVIINQLCAMLGDDWQEICWQPPLQEVTELLRPLPISPVPSPKAAPPVKGLKTPTTTVTSLHVQSNNLETNEIVEKSTTPQKLQQTQTPPPPPPPPIIKMSSSSEQVVDSSSLKFMKMSLDSNSSSTNELDIIATTKILPSLSTSITVPTPSSLLGTTDVSSTFSSEQSMESNSIVNTNTPQTNEINETKSLGCGSNNIIEKKTVKFSEENEIITESGEYRIKDTLKPLHSITERLPPNSFYRDPPNLYIFPGAEIWWDDSDSGSDSSNNDNADGDDDDEDDVNDHDDDDDDDNDDAEVVADDDDDDNNDEANDNQHADGDDDEPRSNDAAYVEFNDSIVDNIADNSTIADNKDGNDLLYLHNVNKHFKSNVQSTKKRKSDEYHSADCTSTQSSSQDVDDHSTIDKRRKVNNI